jgi:hypothetical protein
MHKIIGLIIFGLLVLSATSEGGLSDNKETTSYRTKSESSYQVETYQTERPSVLSNDNYYTNSAGNRVHSPAYSDSVPAGASARCSDGTYSFSQSRRGTCSRHGGVDYWI